MADRLDTGISPKPEPRPRRSSRVPLHADVTLRRAGQNNYRVSVYDVSPEGCKVEFVERPSLDELVWVKFDGLEAIESLVCWIDGMKVGLEFKRPIYSAVFDQLIARLNRSKD